MGELKFKDLNTTLYNEFTGILCHMCYCFILLVYPSLIIHHAAFSPKRTKININPVRSHHHWSCVWINVWSSYLRACYLLPWLPLIKNYHFQYRFLHHHVACSYSCALIFFSGLWPRVREPTPEDRAPLLSSGFPSSATFPS